MIPKYNINFVPEIQNRTKISKLRSKICKETHSTQALQYPVHMSLISGGFRTTNYTLFEKKLKEFSKEQAPIKLNIQKNTMIIPERFWTGIAITETKRLREIRTQLQQIRNEYAKKKETHFFRPLHITLAYPAKVDDLKQVKCPVNELIIRRITITKKEHKTSKYKIYKHISFSK